MDSENLMRSGLKQETEVFVMPERQKVINIINSIFTLAAFPVHIWGFTLHIDLILIFPFFTFTCLWAIYSFQRARETIFRLNLLNGHKKVKITTLSVFGQEHHEEFERSRLKVMLDTGERERGKRVHFRVITGDKPELDVVPPELVASGMSSWLNPANSSLKKYVIEIKKGKVKNTEWFRRIAMVSVFSQK